MTATTALVWFVTLQAASAGPLAISDVPLFLQTGVKPNLMMGIDDSGSMDSELLMRGNDGAAWWRAGTSGTCDATNQNSFVGCVSPSGTSDVPGAGQLNFNYAGSQNNTWRKYAYLFPNGGDNSDLKTDKKRLTDSMSFFAVPPIPAFAWSRSPDYNGTYFDPTIVYTKWPDGGGYTFTDVDKTAAKYDPVYSSDTRVVNLTQDFAGMASVPTTASCSDTDLGTTSGTDWTFRVYSGMTIPAGTCMKVGITNTTSWRVVSSGGCLVGTTDKCFTENAAGVAYAASTVNNASDVNIRYFPATFYLSAASAPPATYGYVSPAAVGVAPDGSTLYRYEIKPSNFDSTEHYTAAINNFANWWTYYRKRHLALRAGLGTAFLSLTNTRVGGFTINTPTNGSATSPDVTMSDIDIVANRTALYTDFYYNWTGNDSTPLRKTIANMIRNYKRTDGNAPITRSCQRNFGMLFTDGFAFPPSTGDGIKDTAGNADGTAGAPYQDSTSDTMADAVWSAWKGPLRTGAGFPSGKVVVPSACSSTPHDPRLDCNTDLHMNFFAITLGARGLLYNPDSPVDPYVTAQTWPSSTLLSYTQNPTQVDDLWHATINGRGQLLTATNSAQLADKLTQILRSIIERIGSASSAAVNSGSINSDTRLFQASFDSKDWSGKLTARDVNLNGTLGPEVLATLPAPASRQIITVNSDKTAVPFLWDSLDTTRQGQLQPSDTNGSIRLNWLRGDQSNEAPNGINLRKRTVILGDIVNSAPAYVGAPAFRYPDTLETAAYSAFRASKATRTHMVYVGGNDGMLHAFSSDDATSGGAVTEKLAFVPSAVFKNLPALTASPYAHQYFVDGSPVTGDAFFGGAWHTMLVAGLNKGGQGVYALDITNPTNFSEANAASIVKWELTDADDADLGYTYSRPSIVRMNDGKWYAAFGNGYNNTVPDGSQSGNGRAFLYFVNIQTGVVTRKISTSTGTSEDPLGQSRPNGLSTPVFIDSDGDSDVDIAYAGDIFGNLWKFDLTSTSPSGWDVAYGAPLFVAKDAGNHPQPITSRPNVSRGPNGQGFVVLFGTGKYLESSDPSNTTDVQSFYGLRDPNTGDGTVDKIASRSDLTQQTITSEQTVTGLGDIRTTSQNAVAAGKRGWYLDFKPPSGSNTGEMQVTDSLIRNDHVVFTTLVPNVDPCEFGGSSWLMEINLLTGGRLDTTPFDLNTDGLFTETATVSGSAVAISGVRTTVGITPKPAPLSGEKCDYLIFPGTSGGTETRCRDPGPRGFGRQSWRQAH